LIDVNLLVEGDSKEYEELVKKSGAGMFYHSLKYRDLLDDFMDDARPLYLVAKRDGKIAGALPSFLKENDRLGNILNSLPFFGSIGGVLVDGELPGELQQEVREKLLGGFDELARDNGCVLSTIITSPFDKESAFYGEMTPDFGDTRTCQIVSLPGKEDGAGEKLLSLFESSGRRNVKRALSAGVDVFPSTTAESMGELVSIHRENISAKGGVVKPPSFFEKIFKHFEPDEDFSIYTAKKDGAVVSALLLFYYNGVVEYFTPATRVEFRSLQVGPLLIYSGMADAIERGCGYWNFGGTWPTQEALYRFKRKWGAADYPYRYIIRKHGDIGHILDLSPAELGEEYRWFYALPHSELKSNGSTH